MALGNHSLGKSLENVLAKTARKTPTAEGGTNGQPAEIPLNVIRPPGNNPRKVFDDNKLQDLSDNILLHGIMQPIVVRKHDVGYEIISENVGSSRTNGRISNHSVYCSCPR